MLYRVINTRILEESPMSFMLFISFSVSSLGIGPTMSKVYMLLAIKMVI